METTFSSTTIYGNKIRTTNTKIEELMALWKTVLATSPTGEIYAVYYNFESNHTGEYDFLIGTIHNPNTESKVIIPEGNYLTITVPDGRLGIAEAWQKIWSDPKLEAKRAYTTDFELYQTDGTVTIYLSLHKDK